MSVLLEHLRSLCSIPDFDTFVASAKQKEQVQSVLCLIRGVCSLENPNVVCISFYSEILPLLSVLFQCSRAQEEIRMSILHILDDEASILGSMTEEANLKFGQTLLTIVTESVRAFPGDDIQIKKASDSIVKILSILFKSLYHASTNTILSDSVPWDTCLMAGYLKLLSAVSSQLTFFPLLMKTIFDTSLMLCKTCIQGIDLQPPDDIEVFFSFMVTSLDRYEYDVNDEWNVVVNLRAWTVSIWCSHIAWRFEMGSNLMLGHGMKGLWVIYLHIQVVIMSIINVRCS